MLQDLRGPKPPGFSAGPEMEPAGRLKVDTSAHLTSLTRRFNNANMPDHTPHQKKIIERYYDQRDVIMLNKLGEIVTELYLADTEKKRRQLWNRARKAMVNLKVPPTIIDHVCAKQDVEVLAHHVRDWSAQAKK